jgi:SpoVK/Ycf46/Vps4 family AAA+-type ATPase
MLLGVQGCGKSLIAKAIAKEWSYPLLRFDLGKVFGGIVGQSEGNIRSALQVAAALEPCVLWIDEIEKGLAGMGSSDRSDGGTTARVVGTLLTWMQEKKEQVFVVATANRIDMLPPELLRKGRFDEIFFVDLPTQSVRRQILKIHLQKRRKLDKATEAKLDELAEQTRGFSGAELEEMVREALLDWYADLPNPKPLPVYLSRVAQQTNPLSVLMSTQIEDLRKWAGQRTRAASEGEPEDLPKKSEKPLLTPTESAQNRFFRPKGDTAN